MKLFYVSHLSILESPPSIRQLEAAGGVIQQTLQQID